MYEDKIYPADTIHDLIRYLKTEDRGQYVYRGQIKEYDAPLVPSRYRKYLSYSDNKVSRFDPQYGHSVKKIGAKYYGDYVAKFESLKNDFFRGFSENKRRALEYIYQKALHSPTLLLKQQTNRIAYGFFESRFDLIRSSLTREEFQIFCLYKDKWIQQIDEYDKRIIRNFGFYKPFGYLLGTALAQQFGFSSDGLDATKDIKVACFFATNSYSSGYKTVEHDGVGIVYRFPFEQVYGERESKQDYDYYSRHSIIDIDDIFANLAYNSECIGSFFDSFAKFYSQVMMDKSSPGVDELKPPRDSYNESRIYRQKAVIILPDEIREDDKESEFSIIKSHLPKYQYIEDISVRNKVKKFYFRHTKNNKIDLNREDLWPREDPFLFLVVWIISAICQRTFSMDHHVILHRLDLIDGGYEAGEFLKKCIDIALEKVAIVHKGDRILLYIE